MLFFFENAKYIHKHSFIFNKTFHYFDKNLFPHLNPTSYLKRLQWKIFIECPFHYFIIDFTDLFCGLKGF